MDNTIGNDNNPHTDPERPPIAKPLDLISFKTINKAFGWWSACVLVSSWGRKQISLYLWQKKQDRWARKQKFSIHNRTDWEKIKKLVDATILELPV